MYTEHSWDVQTWKLSCPFRWMLTWLVFLCAFYWSGSRVTNGPASQPPWKCHAGVNKNTGCMFYKELQLALNHSGFHLGKPSLVLRVSMDEQEDQEMIQWGSEFPSSWTWQPQTYSFTLPLAHTGHSKLLCNLRVLTISDLNSFSPLISDESCWESCGFNAGGCDIMQNSTRSILKKYVCQALYGWKGIIWIIWP